MQLSVTHPRDQVFEVIIEANAVFKVVLTSKSYGRKYSKAKKPKNTERNLKFESANYSIWNMINGWSASTVIKSIPLE